MINQQIIEIQGKLFQVKRKFPEKRINLEVEDGAKILKQYYHCDTLFKAQGLLWVCNEIKDVEYEEITNK
jgi:hypothetical protein|tara:strand:- start:450 stop:659 length:210 start_codon:yes stop_codon:yes gene_type:complete